MPRESGRMKGSNAIALQRAFSGQRRSLTTRHKNTPRIRRLGVLLCGSVRRIGLAIQESFAKPGVLTTLEFSPACKEAVVVTNNARLTGLNAVAFGRDRQKESRSGQSSDDNASHGSYFHEDPGGTRGREPVMGNDESCKNYTDRRAHSTVSTKLCYRRVFRDEARETPRIATQNPTLRSLITDTSVVPDGRNGPIERRGAVATPGRLALLAGVD